MDAVREAIAAMRSGEKVVDLEGKGVGVEGAKELAQELATNSTLTALDLQNNNIGAEGCTALAVALQSPHCALTTLEFDVNNIGDDGCAALASALQSPHCKVSALLLRENNIGDEGCAALASALQSPHCSLTTLDLYKNSISNKGACLLADALERNTSLVHIDLRENDGVSVPIRARILALLHLSRDGIADVPRRLVAKLSDELLQEVSFTTYEEKIKFGDNSYTWNFGCIADFNPILAALH